MKSSLLHLFFVLFVFSYSLQVFSCVHGKRSQVMLDGCLHKSCARCLKKQLRKSYAHEGCHDLILMEEVELYCKNCRETRVLTLEQLQKIFRTSIKKLLYKSVEGAEPELKKYVPRALEALPKVLSQVFQKTLYQSLLQKTLSTENIAKLCHILRSLVIKVKKAYEQEAEQRRESERVDPFLSKSPRYYPDDEIPYAIQVHSVDI